MELTSCGHSCQFNIDLRNHIERERRRERERERHDRMQTINYWPNMRTVANRKFDLFRIIFVKVIEQLTLKGLIVLGSLCRF